MGIEALRRARRADSEAIARLVNRAYRPEQGAAGWTHESELVAGERVSVVQVEALIAHVDSAVLLGLREQEIVACVLIEKKGAVCHIGMLAVDPRLQGGGLGKEMLALAECYARDGFGAERVGMRVLSARSELISFYQRRGYRRTGRVEDYPLAAGVGTPKRGGLMVELLEKRGLCQATAGPTPCMHGKSA